MVLASVLDKNLFLELDKSAGTSSLDWKPWLSLMGLFADRSRLESSGLANRSRVFGIMYSLKNTETITRE